MPFGTSTPPRLPRPRGMSESTPLRLELLNSTLSILHSYTRDRSVPDQSYWYHTTLMLHVHCHQPPSGVQVPSDNFFLATRECSLEEYSGSEIVQNRP